MEHSEKIKKLKEACERFNRLINLYNEEEELVMSLRHLQYLSVFKCEKEISAELNSALETLYFLTEIIEKEKEDPVWFISQKIALKEFPDASEKLDLIFKHISIKCVIPFTDKEKVALYILDDLIKLIRKMEKI